MDESLRRAAKSLRDNPVLPMVLDELRADTVARWESSETPAEREACWAAITCIETIRETVNVRTRELARDGDDAAGS